jgi:hypothetical protein
LFEKVGEVGRREALDVPDTNIAKEVVVTGRRLPPNETAEGISELSLHSQAGELGENGAYRVLRDYESRLPFEFLGNVHLGPPGIQSYAFFS